MKATNRWEDDTEMIQWDGDRDDTSQQLVEGQTSDCHSMPMAEDSTKVK